MFDRAKYNKAYREAHREEALAYGRAYYLANKEKSKTYQKDRRKARRKDILARQKEYVHRGLDEQSFLQAVESQNNACAICLEPFTETPQVDHDHRCCGDVHSCEKCRRGLLCKHCNRSIGGLKDSVEVLQRAVAYLSKYESRGRQQ